MNAVFRARVKQTLTFRVFAHRVDIITCLDSADDLGPGLAIVFGAEDVRRAIFLQIILHRDISGARPVRRGIDQTYAREIGQAWRSYSRPVLSFRARNENQTVSPSGPQRATFQS